MAEKMKRILVISQHYWPESFRITDICEGFCAMGAHVDVLCGLPNYPKGDWFDGYGYFKKRREEKNGVQLYRAGEIRRRGNTGARIFLNYISYPVTACINLLRLIGKRYDAVFCYETSPVLMLLPAITWAKLTRTPLTTYVLDLWPENLYSVLPVKNSAARAIAKGVSHWLYRRSDKLIAMSPLLQERLQKIAPKRRTAVIPQYCEDFYNADVHDKELSERFKGKFCIVFAGNISPAQNLDLLTKCASLLKKNNIDDIHFVIVGSGMSENSLRQSVDSLGLCDMFSFEGRVSPQEIPKYHTLAGALFAALTKTDDLGLTVPAKITSYMAAARPLLISIDGEAARVVNEAGCGLTCPAANAEALYNNIIALYQMNDIQRAVLGNNARDYYQKNYSRKKLLTELYNFILS